MCVCTCNGPKQQLAVKSVMSLSVSNCDNKTYSVIIPSLLLQLEVLLRSHVPWLVTAVHHMPPLFCVGCSRSQLSGDS